MDNECLWQSPQCLSPSPHFNIFLSIFSSICDKRGFIWITAHIMWPMVVIHFLDHDNFICILQGHLLHFPFFFKKKKSFPCVLNSSFSIYSYFCFLGDYQSYFWSLSLFPRFLIFNRKKNALDNFFHNPHGQS